MRQDCFNFFCDLLRKKSGLSLGADKTYLLESRLLPVAKKWKFETIELMADAMRLRGDSVVIKDVIEAMTTNETSFFRDNKPFETFKSAVLPYFINSRPGRKNVRIWCAAASSGQEPYSLAMILKENAAQLAGWHIDIVATDISLDILDLAKAGECSQFEVQRGLPVQMLMKYFEQKGDRWKIKDELRRMIRYDYFNLLDSMAGLGQFDVIFCRNVLIYFDEETKKDILNRMAAQMSPDGMLFLGGAETVVGYTDAFKPHESTRGLYILKNGKYSTGNVFPVAARS